jgi:hypothetical protein
MKTENRSFKSYKLLSQSLSRNGVQKSGVTASTLLEAFIHLNGELKSSFVQGKGLCEPGKFKEWREDLIKSGWLSYTFGDYSRHSPGPKLIKYINKEKLASLEIASIPDVEHIVSKAKEEMATKEELVAVKEKLEARVSLLEEAVKNMIEEFDPPVTEEKIQRRLKVVREK